MLLLLHLVGLRILLVLKLPSRFILSVQNHQLLSELLILHAELLPDLDEASQAINILGILIINVLVDFQGLVEQVHSTVARSNHERPLVLLRLDLLSALEIDNSLFKHVVFGVMHTEARDHINLGRVVPVRFLVEVHSLELVLLLLIEVTHLSEDLRITRHLGDQDVVPFQSLASHTDQFVNVSDLVDNFV